MFEQIINWDKQLLLTLNSYHNPWLDRFMWMLSDTIVWIPFFIIFFIVLVKNKQANALLLLIAFALLILITDRVSSGILKPLIERLRPSHDPELGDWVITVNNYKGGLYGFVSSHAANFFGFAVLSLLFIRSWSYSVTIISWALLISYSRMYLGVHYPLDIFFGIVLGILSAFLMYKLYTKFVDKPNTRKRGHNVRSQSRKSDSDFKNSDIFFLQYTLILIVVILFITSFKLAW